MKPKHSGIHDLSITFASKMGMLCALLGTQSCLAWLLGPADRGSYAVCLLFATILSTVFSMGCSLASIYFVSSKRLTLSEGVVYTLLYGVMGSAIAIAVGLIVMQFPLPFFEKAAEAEFYLALVFIPLSLFSVVFLGLFTAIHQFRYYAVLSVMNAVAYLVFTLLFVWVFSWGVRGALLANLCGSILNLSITVALFRYRFGVVWTVPTLKSLVEMFHYGIRSYLGSISYLINFRIGLIIVALFSTKAEIGVFALATHLVVQSMLIPATVTNVLIPRSSADDEGRKELVARCARLTVLVCGILLLALSVLATPLVSILFSPDFLPAVPLIRIMAVGFTIRAGARVLVPYLVGTDRPGIASCGAATGMVVNLAVLWFLLPRIGVSAAAWSLTIGYFASSTVIAVSFSRLSGLRLSKTWAVTKDDCRAMYGLLKGVWAKVGGVA